MASDYNKIAEELAGRVKFLRIDVNQNRETCEKVKMKSMPSFKIYKSGECKETIETNDAEVIICKIREYV